ncbi:MAG: hypothetical protein GY845_24075 [Planctomycetes bacterium]|nr:hypothetical protein [Planctomycetota bacterium]
MNTKTKTPIKKAGGFGGRPAGRNKLQKRAYPKPAPLSSLKMLIGELLIFGNEQRKETWWLFDSKLRQFYDLKICEGKR